MNRKVHTVTGAFGFSGSYIARKLLDAGKTAATLTNSRRDPDPFEGRVNVHPLRFDKPEELAENLAGTSVFYNTYWMRFNEVVDGHSEAYRNSIKLFNAAKTAGVERIVHISITNPSADSPIDYFREKAELERELKALGIPYAILRPAVIFGPKSILINNIAWALRKLPVFGYFGSGNYEIQPIHVEDLAELAVRAGEGRENEVVNAVGPEKFRYKDMVKEVATAIDRHPLILPAPKFVGYLVGLIIGKFMGDVMMTRDELKALTGGLLAVETEPTGKIRLSEWMRANADTLGVDYARMPKHKRTDASHPQR